MLKTIFSRRSIRSFTKDPVSSENEEQLLRAAMQAPSAGNQQPWHFVVLREKALLEAIPGFHPYAAMAPSAPLAILVCGDLSLEKHEGYWIQDCSAAVQNLLLAAEALGLGAVWLGVHPRKDREDGFRKLLKLPVHIIPFALVPVGHPVEKAPAADRFNRERVHRDSW